MNGVELNRIESFSFLPNRPTLVLMVVVEVVYGGCGTKKERIAVNGFPPHSYGTSLAIWDHIVLPATRHK